MLLIKKNYNKAKTNYTIKNIPVWIFSIDVNVTSEESIYNETEELLVYLLNTQLLNCFICHKKFYLFHKNENSNYSVIINLQFIIY